MLGGKIGNKQKYQSLHLGKKIGDIFSTNIYF